MRCFDFVTDWCRRRRRRKADEDDEDEDERVSGGSDDEMDVDEQPSSPKSEDARPRGTRFSARNAAKVRFFISS